MDSWTFARCQTAHFPIAIGRVASFSGVGERSYGKMRSGTKVSNRFHTILHPPA
jgi:hypothetical protein